MAEQIDLETLMNLLKECTDIKKKNEQRKAYMHEYNKRYNEQNYEKRTANKVSYRRGTYKKTSAVDS